MKYTVKTHASWRRDGVISIDAESAEEAESIAYEMMLSNDEAVTWTDESRQSAVYVDSVKEGQP